MKKQVQVEVESSGLELAQHLAKIVKAYKAALADGWQVGSDVPAIVLSVINEGPGMMMNLGQVGGDIAEDKLEFLKGVNLGGYEIAEAALGK